MMCKGHDIKLKIGVLTLAAWMAHDYMYLPEGICFSVPSPRFNTVVVEKNRYTESYRISFYHFSHGCFRREVHLKKIRPEDLVEVISTMIELKPEFA